MACRGTCERYRSKLSQSGPAYDGTRCRCQTCGVWLQASMVVMRAAGEGRGQAGNWCPCCGMRVRVVRRGGRAARPAAAPDAAVVAYPFYENGQRYMGMNDLDSKSGACLAATATATATTDTAAAANREPANADDVRRDGA